MAYIMRVNVYFRTARALYIYIVKNMFSCILKNYR